MLQGGIKWRVRNAEWLLGDVANDNNKMLKRCVRVMREYGKIKTAATAQAHNINKMLAKAARIERDKADKKAVL
jgi:hypothetical protein